jgi:hypothetical protein
MTLVSQHMINDFQILDGELNFSQAIEMLEDKQYGLVKNADLKSSLTNQFFTSGRSLR